MLLVESPSNNLFDNPHFFYRMNGDGAPQTNWQMVAWLYSEIMG
jgi:hypothetical protein